MDKCIGIDDKEYPPALKEIGKFAPQKLYYKGNWPALSEAEGAENIFKNCLAVVGSRRLTSYGRRAISQIVGEIAASGITIVSGFMYGGDEAAHSAAVKCGGRTIAVMPCGINIIHPKNQEKLYKEILENNGLVISEYEGEILPQNFMYVQRDRIVAGLAKAVFVAEAAEASGSLITAGYAKKYGRKVFALPGPITSEVSKGTNKLIREGAELVAEARDILSFYKVLVGQKREPAFAKATAGKCSTLEQKIISQLKLEAMKADELARMFSVPVAQLGTELSLMEMKGFISQENGKYYVN